MYMQCSQYLVVYIHIHRGDLLSSTIAVILTSSSWWSIELQLMFSHTPTSSTTAQLLTSIIPQTGLCDCQLIYIHTPFLLSGARSQNTVVTVNSSSLYQYHYPWYIKHTQYNHLPVTIAKFANYTLLDSHVYRRGQELEALHHSVHRQWRRSRQLRHRQG